jgi:NAD(P)H-dependent FMN reductase
MLGRNHEWANKYSGFAGSLRQGSYNRALLRAALEFVPNGAKLDVFELDGIPPFNGDLESSPPEKVKEFKRRIMYGVAGIVTVGILLDFLIRLFTNLSK